MALLLKNIRFPVYPLSKSVNVKRDEELLIVGTSTGKEYILDDKSIKMDSLGRRRLHIDQESLYPLKRAVYTIGDFLLYTKLYKTFIDSNGKLFNYEAKTKVPLIYRKILDTQPYKGGTMLSIESVHCPIFYYRPIIAKKEYAALLYIEKGYVLLGVTDSPSKRVSLKV